MTGKSKNLSQVQSPQWWNEESLFALLLCAENANSFNETAKVFNSRESSVKVPTNMHQWHKRAMGYEQGHPYRRYAEALQAALERGQATKVERLLGKPADRAIDRFNRRCECGGQKASKTDTACAECMALHTNGVNGDGSRRGRKPKNGLAVIGADVQGGEA